jgi:hypothetical protein
MAEKLERTPSSFFGQDFGKKLKKTCDINRGRGGRQKIAAFF